VTADQALVDAVRVALVAAGDPVRARGAQAYMKSAMPFHGVPVPEVRRIARAELGAHPLPDRQTWHDTVLELWDGATHREERYAALALLRSSWAAYQDLASLELIRHLVVTGAECLDANLADPAFFIRKAIGWALRDLARADPVWVTAFVETAGDRLSPLSRREATKHLPALQGAPSRGGR
jgi:3-methyladenine DNA glycosylase AlkD